MCLKNISYWYTGLLLVSVRLLKLNNSNFTTIPSWSGLACGHLTFDCSVFGCMNDVRLSNSNCQSQYYALCLGVQSLYSFSFPCEETHTDQFKTKKKDSSIFDRSGLLRYSQDWKQLLKSRKKQHIRLRGVTVVKGSNYFPPKKKKKERKWSGYWIRFQWCDRNDTLLI